MLRGVRARTAGPLPISYPNIVFRDAGFEKQAALAPKLHRSPLPPSAPGPPPAPSTPILFPRSNKRGPARSMYPLPHEAVDSAPNSAHATFRAAPPDSAVGYIQNAARYKPTSKSPSPLPPLPSAKNPAHAPATSDEPAANYQYVLLCDIRS